MTNQTRDFDRDDARELADFAGLDITEIYDGHVFVMPPFEDAQIDDAFYPWHERSEQWQIQSLKNAVREKGLEEEFDFELSHMIYEGGDQLTAIDYASAPPEAICSAVLQIIPEGSGDSDE